MDGSYCTSPDEDRCEVDPSERYICYDELLEKGAFKRVYKGFDLIEGMEVAWNKVSLDQMLDSPENLTRICSKVHFLKNLKHENILKFYTAWIDHKKRTLNIITELFTSGSLKSYRNKHKDMDMKVIKHWARQILKGLEYLHGHNPPIIHRDLKCDNIFINGNHGKVKIGDLGLTTIMHRPEVQAFVGTPEFMAPELYGEEYTELSDIYSFGMCLLEMFTLDYPYCECRNAGQIYTHVISGLKPAALEKIINKEAREFIEKCLVPASERKSAKELLNDPFLQCSDKLDVSSNIIPIGSPTAESLNSSDASTSTDVDSEIKAIDFNSNRQVLEFRRVNKDREFRLVGQQNDANSVSLILSHVRSIHFLFFLDTDTPLSVATEMAEQLDSDDYDASFDVAFIAALINDLISSLVPHWQHVSKRSNVENRSTAECVSIDDVSVPDSTSLAFISDGAEGVNLKVEKEYIEAKYQLMKEELMKKRNEELDKVLLRYMLKKRET